MTAETVQSKSELPERSRHRDDFRDDSTATAMSLNELSKAPKVAIITSGGEYSDATAIPLDEISTRPRSGLETI